MMILVPPVQPNAKTGRQENVTNMRVIALAQYVLALAVELFLLQTMIVCGSHIAKLILVIKSQIAKKLRHMLALCSKLD